MTQEPASKNPYKRRVQPPARPVTRPQPVDPAVSIQQHGVHGTRQEQPVPLPTSSRRLATVPISAIRPGRYQKRETIDLETYEQLKARIKENGLGFTPILCPDPDDPTFHNPMMGGHLRLQAAAELGIEEVQAIVREYDRLTLAKGTYGENNGRQPLTLIDEGLLFQQCQEDFHWSQEEVAQELLVPGGRNRVKFALLAVRESSDIQDMLRKDPERGLRCFIYLRRLNDLGEERAKEVRAPIIERFLKKEITVDDVEILVERALKKEQRKGGDSNEEVDVEQDMRSTKYQRKALATVKSFRSFKKEIGDSPPTQEVRASLLEIRQGIDEILARE